MPRVLIIRPGALGDSLMLLPALKDLEGKVRITLVGRQPGIGFIRPYVDSVMDLEGSGWHRLFMHTPDPKGLPVSDMDIAMAFFGDEGDLIRRNLEQSLPGAAIHLFRSFPCKGEAVHTAEHLARCLASAGLPVDPERCIRAAKKGVLCQERRRPERQKKIVLHPGSGSIQKNHPPAFWIDLMGRFRQDRKFMDFTCIVLLGPAEHSLYACIEAGLGSRNAEIVCSWDSDHLLRTLERASLYVGHDSGVTHLSAMRCVPTVALFKNSDPAQWAPVGPFVRLAHGRKPDPDLIDEILCAARDLVWQDSLSAP